MFEVTKAPSACLCFKKENHKVKEDLQNNYCFNSLLNTSESRTIQPFFAEDLVYLGTDSNIVSVSSGKIESANPLYKKIQDRSIESSRVRILSNNIFDHMGIRHSTFSKSPNDDVKLGLKKRTEILIKQLEFAVYYRITSLKASLIACSGKGLVIKKENTDTQSGSYLTDEQPSFLKRSLDMIDLTNKRKFDECHVAAITSLKNAHPNIDEIIADLRSTMDFKEVIDKYSLLGQEPLIQLLKIMLVNENDQGKLITEICSQLQKQAFGKTSCINIFKQIFKSNNFELKKSVHSLAPNFANELMKSFISELSRTDKIASIDKQKQLKTAAIDEYNQLNPQAPLETSKRAKKPRLQAQKVKQEEIFLQLILTLRKNGSDQIHPLMNLVESQFPEPDGFRDFVFNSLGKSISDIQNCIFGHFLPINSLAGIMGTETVSMHSEINHGLDAQTDILARKFVSSLLTTFSNVDNPTETELQNFTHEFQEKLFETYESYANSKNTRSTIAPKLEELVANISEPDEEMQRIFNQLDLDPTLQNTVLWGLSYIGFLADNNHDKVTIGNILNYITDRNVLENQINDLNSRLIASNQRGDIKRLITTLTGILNNFDQIVDKINQLNLPESIKNKEIETAPYASMHNFIEKNEDSIAFFCADIIQKYDESNFEHNLLGKTLKIDDVDRVTTPLVDFYLCEGLGDEFCWEKV